MSLYVDTFFGYTMQDMKKLYSKYLGNINKWGSINYVQAKTQNLQGNPVVYCDKASGPRVETQGLANPIPGCPSFLSFPLYFP
jgi:hypothetical protein